MIEKLSWQCFNAASASIGQPGSSAAVQKILYSAPSIIFFRSCSAKICMLFGQNEAFSYLQDSKIFGFHLCGRFTSEDEKMSEKLLEIASDDYKRCHTTPSSRALFAGTSIADASKNDGLKFVNVVIYILSMCAD